MTYYFLRRALAAGVLAVTGSATAASLNDGNVGSDGRVPENPPAATKSKDSVGDCREHMANARQAVRSGHSTEKEYAEQKKMAQSKLDGPNASQGTAARHECAQ